MTTPNAHSSHAVLIAVNTELRQELAAVKAERDEARKERDSRPKPDDWYASNRAIKRLEDNERSLEARLAEAKRTIKKFDSDNTDFLFRLTRQDDLLKASESRAAALEADLALASKHRDEANRDLAALKQESERMREALKNIAYQDYRGNRCPCAGVAFAALSPSAKPQEQK